MNYEADYLFFLVFVVVVFVSNLLSFVVVVVVFVSKAKLLLNSLNFLLKLIV